MRDDHGLDDVIAACVDDQLTLEHESGFIDGSTRAALLRLAEERGRFVAQLQVLGGDHAHRPREHGSWREIAREVWRSAAVMLAGRSNRGDALAECRRSRDRTDARYEESSRRPWPAVTRAVLLEQCDRIRSERAELIALQF